MTEPLDDTTPTTTPAPATIAETVAGAAQGVAESAQKVTQRATEAVRDAPETVVRTAQQATDTAQTAARAATVPVRVAQRRGRIFVWIAVGALAGFAALVVAVHGRQTNRIDLRITQLVQAEQRRQPWLAWLMRWASAPGFAPWSWAIPIGTAASLRWLGYRLEARFMLATGIANAFVSLVKITLARPRPAHPSIVVAAQLRDHSFPSGHTVQYMAQFGYIAYLAFALLRPSYGRQALLGVCAALIGLVGPSRIGLGQHWASDVAASYCLGTAFLIGHVGLYRRLKSGQRPVAPGTSQTLPVADMPLGGQTPGGARIATVQRGDQAERGSPSPEVG